MKNRILLRDYEDFDFYAILTTELSAREIEKIIRDIKNEREEDWTLEYVYGRLVEEGYATVDEVYELEAILI